MGLCPQCLLSMALEDVEENPTLQGPGPGGILGERYQIREVLGRGGMGEVYRAFDLKLRVDVALKAVRPELSSRPPILRIWDLETGELRKLELKGNGERCRGEAENDINDLDFLSNRRVLIFDGWGIRLWNLEDGSSLEVRPCQGKEVHSTLTVDSQRGRILVVDVNDVEHASTLGLYDLESKTYREITSHGNRVWSAALDPTGTVVVTGDLDGVVRAGPITGEEPHLLFGHPLAIYNVAVSPDGKWIASGSLDGTIRLWPMPEGTPFHTLPYNEILERIRALTNLRVVPDESSGTGYRAEIGPFPGWKTASHLVRSRFSS